MNSKQLEQLQDEVIRVRAQFLKLIPNIEKARGYFKYQDNYTDEISEDMIVAAKNGNLDDTIESIQTLIEYVREEE